MMANRIIFAETKEHLKEAGEIIASLEPGEHGVFIEIRIGTRTLKQNSSIHVYLRILAKILRAAGIDMRKLLKPTIEIPATEELVKNHIWCPIQLALTGKESTKKLTRKEVSEVYDVVDQQLSEKHGIQHIPFPQNRFPNEPPGDM